MDQIVRKYHSKQLRNDKEGYLSPKVPYFDHLESVRHILSFALYKFGECQDPQLEKDILNAAIGHDLLEDTDITEAEIIEASNERVLSLIKELTNPVDDEHTDQYMDQIKNASEEARLIKYADLIENTSCVCYNFHVVGRDWAYDFYRPLMYRTEHVLDATSFPTYPRTVEYLRTVLNMFVDMLNWKYCSNPFQYPVKVLQCQREAISETDLNNHILKSRESFTRLMITYKKGCMIRDDLVSRFNSEFHETFYNYLDSKRLVLRFNEKRWERFIADYSLWKKNEKPSAQAGEPWLLYYEDYLEASILDKISFFKLMDEYLVPVERFKPARDSCIRPRHRYLGYGDGIAGVVTFKLIDDGGLSTDPDPIGKTFTLVDDLGLKAVIEIIRKTPEEDNRCDNRMESKYDAIGTIEGYTSTRKRKIYVSEIDRQVGFYVCDVHNDDLDVLHSLPLWKEFNEYIAEKRKICDEHIETLINHYEKTSGGRNLCK